VRIALADALCPDGVGRSYMAQGARLLELAEKVFRDGIQPPFYPEVHVRGIVL